MRKIATMACTAIIAQALFLTTPAFADTVTPDTASQTALQGASDIAKPRNTPGVTYTAEPYVTNTVTTFVELSRVTIEDIPGGILLSQSPYTFTSGSEHRNGYSTNIHGDYSSTAVYSGGRLVQEITELSNTVFTYGCNVYLTNGGQTNLAPPGRQVAPVLTRNQQSAPTTRTETVSKPDVTVVLHAEKVICISPKKNPGTWTNQNGYTGVCGSALYNAVALGGPVPSNSVPGVERLLPNAPDQQTALPEDQTYYPPFPDEPEAAPVEG